MTEVKTEKLELSRSDKLAGIVSLLCITFKRMTVVVAEDDDGLMAIGVNVSWPGTAHIPHIGLSAARHHAVNRMEDLRTRRYAKPNRVSA